MTIIGIPNLDQQLEAQLLAGMKDVENLIRTQVEGKYGLAVETSRHLVDAGGKIQNKTLEPGAGASFYGRPPLKVLTSGVAQVDIYYQGVKVRPSNSAAKNIILEPAEVI